MQCWIGELQKRLHSPPGRILLAGEITTLLPRSSVSPVPVQALRLGTPSNPRVPHSAALRRRGRPHRSPIPMADKSPRSCWSTPLPGLPAIGFIFDTTLEQVEMLQREREEEELHPFSSRLGFDSKVWQAQKSQQGRSRMVGTLACDLCIIPLLPSKGIFPRNSQ